MKLDPDCIRDILFIVEELSDGISYIYAESINKRLKKYDELKILYHVKQMDFANLIIAPNDAFTIDGNYFIKDLTPNGHEFLSNIRKDNNWIKIKSIACKTGSMSISVLTSIASNVITNIISKQLKLPL